MPDYGDGNVMRGPLHRLTIGNYFDAQLGILNSLSYTVPNDRNSNYSIFKSI